MPRSCKVLGLSGLAVALSTSWACDALKPAKLEQFQVDSGTDVVVDTDDTDTPTPVGNDNRPPIANAGMDQRGIEPGQGWLLDGSASSDPEGQPLTYLWTLVNRPQGSIASVTNATSVAASIYLDVPGEYVVELMVDDGYDQDSDTVRLQVDQENQPPIADAGFDQVVSLGATIQLSAAGSYDPDGDQLDYLWEFQSKPPGSVATLNGATVQPAIAPRFLADVPGTYSVRLVVDDGELTSAPDTVNVQVQDTSGGSSGGGSSSSDCLSCANSDEVDRVLRAGDAASTLGLLALPLLALLHHRRRDD